jgi:hypothetical protein
VTGRWAQKLVTQAWLHASAETGVWGPSVGRARGMKKMAARRVFLEWAKLGTTSPIGIPFLFLLFFSLSNLDFPFPFEFQIQL